jgi:DNA polymerase-1
MAIIDHSYCDETFTSEAVTREGLIAHDPALESPCSSTAAALSDAGRSWIDTHPLMQTYTEVWLVDFEYGLTADGLPDPVCLVAWELKSGRRLRLWRDEFRNQPPYRIDASALFVAYYASAEIGCHLALGWPIPVRILDLYTEFRNLTNGLPTVAGNGLLGALAHCGLDGIEVAEKEHMRRLILGGGPWSQGEQEAILAYCETDVVALTQLLTALAQKIDPTRALLRGRSMGAVAQIERNGVPLDIETLARLKKHWPAIKDRLIGAVDKDYGVYQGQTFKYDLFAAWLAKQGISWPHLASGRLDLSDDTFREMSRAHPLIAPLHELRSTLSRMRLAELPVGADGRNRTLLSPFSSKTGRNQPSNSRFIFGPSTWLRGLIKPPIGSAVACIDWEQQEFGIAGALSADVAMKHAYDSGDPYLEFAKQAGAVPPDATKDTHEAERAQFKACALAVQYGMGAGPSASGSRRGGRGNSSSCTGRYRTFWAWSDASLNYAMLTSSLPTVFGWTLHIGDRPNERSVRNFPMQANGAEMLRLACCMATEQGIELCAPVHDAVLIMAPLERVGADVTRMQEIMAEASRIVLDGFALRSDATIVRYPDRYMDKRGKAMWDTVMTILTDLETEAG